MRPAVLLFCVTYSLFVALYLLVQKRNYRFYHHSIESIEDQFHGDRRRETPRVGRVLTSFRIYLAFPLIIGSGLVGLLTYTLSESVALSGSAAVAYFAAIMAATWLKAFR